MSESKARRALRETEEAFGFKIIEKVDYLPSELTPEGEVLHEIYEQIEAELNLFAKTRFAELIRGRL
jgi:DNA-binding transcriptional LysR family regulator